MACGVRLRVSPGNRAPNRGAEKLWRSRSPQPWVSDRLKRVGWRISGRLQLRPASRRARRRPGLQAQVREDLLDYRLLKDRGDDLQLAAAVGAVFQVDLNRTPFGGRHEVTMSVIHGRPVRSLATNR